MLSDVTITVANHAVSFPGLYLLVGVLVVVGLAGVMIAIVSARGVERRANDAADVLVVQLERIGDALDRIVKQNAERQAAGQTYPVAASRDRKGQPWPAAVRSAAEAKFALDRQPLHVTAPTSTPEPVILASDAGAPVKATPSADNGSEQKPVEQNSPSNLSEPARSILFSMLGR